MAKLLIEFIESRFLETKKLLGSSFTPLPTSRLLLLAMRNACLEHFPGWSDRDQALSFVTLIAHLSGSWSEANFSKGDFGLFCLYFSACMYFCGPVRWAVSSLFGTRPSSCIERLWAEKTQHMPVLWRTLTTSQTGPYGEPPGKLLTDLFFPPILIFYWSVVDFWC